MTHFYGARVFLLNELNSRNPERALYLRGKRVLIGLYHPRQISTRDAGTKPIRVLEVNKARTRITERVR